MSNEWSKTVPTEEGWYWWRRDSGQAFHEQSAVLLFKGYFWVGSHVSSADEWGGEWCRIPSLAEVERLRGQVAMLRRSLKEISELTWTFDDAYSAGSKTLDIVESALTATDADVAAWQAAQPPAEPTANIAIAGRDALINAGLDDATIGDAVDCYRAMIAAGEKK